MKQQSSDTLNRRGFITLVTATIFSFWIWVLQSCKIRKIHSVKITGASHLKGHTLWKKQFPEPTQFLETDILIVGGGVAALSASRSLSDSGCKITILELEDQPGGNSASHSNAHSQYPLGAHYLPFPNDECEELLDFLKQASIYLGKSTQGEPIYNEYDVCFAPDSRLYIHGHWQTGLIPNLGVPEADLNQIKQFFSLVDELKNLKGKDGKFLFAIPVDSSSEEEEWRKLDTIFFSDYLFQKGFTSTYLIWYLNYCCRDDYGGNIRQISAWAGLHYFACRRGKSADSKESLMLTWPEGNARLVNELKKQQQAEIFTSHVVYSVEENTQGVQVKSFDAKTNTSSVWQCNKVIMASPQFVNAFLIPDEERKTLSRSMVYSPWLIANLVVDNSLNRSGAELSWDNVLYNSDCLGYINANHQDVNGQHKKIVITYYEPLDALDAVQARRLALKENESGWAERVFENLSKAHPAIKDLCDSMELWIWGHGMVRPVPGYIWGEKRQRLKATRNKKIYFAHSDLAGVSIFEEAFYQGIRVANEINHDKSPS
jgi:protoporphyrinogen oxidase